MWPREVKQNYTHKETKTGSSTEHKTEVKHNKRAQVNQDWNKQDNKSKTGELNTKIENQNHEKKLSEHLRHVWDEWLRSW